MKRVLRPHYSKILRPHSEFEPALSFYNDKSHQHELLIRELEQLEKEGYNGKEVVILSPVNNSCASTISDKSWKNKLHAYNSSTSSEAVIGYCSIKRFKGLEAPAVIVTDIEQLSDQDSIALFYIAISRAVARLSILVHENARDELKRLMNM
jgi:superfamily I DNA/RNA helicase